MTNGHFISVNNTFYGARDTTKTFTAGKTVATVGVSTQYELLDYIGVSNGTSATSGPFIDTGKTVKNNTGVEVRFRANSNATHWCVFGARGAIDNSTDGSGEARDFTFWAPASDAPAYEFGNRKVKDTGVSYANRDVTVKVLGGLMYGDGRAMKGTSSSNKIDTREGFDLNVYIGADNYAQVANDVGAHCFVYGGVNYYYYRQFEGEQLVLDLIPAKRTSDNAVGMLDMVSGAFFCNAGTGSFTAGTSKGLTVYR